MRQCGESLDGLNKTHVTENGESETAVQDALDQYKDHAAENDEIELTSQERIQHLHNKQQ